MITSTSNAQMKNLKELLTKSKERKKQQCFVVEGIRMVSETPKDRLVKLYVSASFLKQADKQQGMDLTDAIVVDDAVFKQISDTQTPQGIMAVVRKKEASLEDLLKVKNPMFLILENIQDPGNLGTMMRTAEGAGVTGVIMSRDTVDIYNPKTVRSTMGSLYRMPFVYVEDLHYVLEELRRSGVSLYAAHLKGKADYDQMDYIQPTGFLIGNEGNGLKDETTKMATDYILIPMDGQLESLNAAVAAAILMYEGKRQRKRLR